HMDPFEETPVDLIEQMMLCNVIAPLHLVKLCLPTMKRQGGGIVINITSSAGERETPAPIGQGGWGLGYSLSKAALNRMVPGLARRARARALRLREDPMRLGLMLGYWMPDPWDPTDLVQEAERLGYESAWTAEAYGSDVFSPLCWIGARTSRIKLGTAIMQISARTPACAAMTVATIDHLSGGRLILGIGVSGPQVVEGWYGQPFPRPLARTREFVEVIRKILARDAPVTNDGPHYPMPYPGGAQLGKPLKITVHPLRANVPIYLGAEGPRNVALATEIADGWFPIFYSPGQDGLYREALAEGFSRPGARRT